MVYGVCRLILRDPTDAEDAAQQTFLSAYRALLAGQEPREPSAWLGTIARNECRGRLRSRRAEPLTLVTAAAVGDETQREVERRAEVEALSAALAELPQQQRDAIVLREFYGLSYAEVAAALGVSAAAVESLLFRSRRRLQEHLRPLRAALGALALPPTLSQSLAQALPGFGGGAGASAGAVALAKVGSAPFAAKLAALTLAVGTAGTVAGIETGVRHRAPQRVPRAARPAAVQPRILKAPLAAAAVPVSATRRSTRTSHETDGRSDRGKPAGDERAQHGDDNSTATGKSEPEHEVQTSTQTEQQSADDGGSSGADNSGSGKSDDQHSGSGGGGDHHGDDGSGGGSGD
jgi:RNA polymerase sigma factor (sigma-70 family)